MAVLAEQWHGSEVTNLSKVAQDFPGVSAESLTFPEAPQSWAVFCHPQNLQLPYKQTSFAHDAL